jgi:hypothetical protein
MKKSQKITGVIEMYGDMENLSDAIGWMELGNYETRRQLERVSAACILVSKDGRPFPEAYRWIVTREKEALLGMLKRQLKCLGDMRTPEPILKQLNRDIQTVEKAIARLKKMSAEQMANKMAREFDRNSENSALELAIRFVGSAAYDALTRGAKGRARIKKLMEG